ncbi:hypothetical protein HanRHA438_Chr13g0605041 [Helianthus annuus]|nr:hypothetical protein HanRHA438_Chr13g0605041 [Helianthus annuus]
MISHHHILFVSFFISSTIMNCLFCPAWHCAICLVFVTFNSSAATFLTAEVSTSSLTLKCITLRNCLTIFIKRHV